MDDSRLLVNWGSGDLLQLHELAAGQSVKFVDFRRSRICSRRDSYRDSVALISDWWKLHACTLSPSVDNLWTVLPLVVVVIAD